MRGRTSLQLFLSLLFLWGGYAINPLTLDLEVPCEPCDLLSCEPPPGCPGGTVFDSCGCCEVCAKAVGEQCVPGECDQDAGVVCIPDDPYAAVQIGTCQDQKSPCLMFGCEAEDSQCHCSYSTSCPPRVFSYSTLEECQDSLQQSACESAKCPTEECPEGMSYDPGFLIPGECCPVGGSCICDFSQCEVPTCPNDTQAVVMSTANETYGQCCDVLECKPLEFTSCQFYDSQVSHGSTIQLGPCTVCECSNGSLICIQEACPVLSCESGSSVLPEGQCCPECLPVDPTPSPSTLPPPPIFSNCISPTGLLYVDGERWKEDACTFCKCRSGQVLCSSIQCEAPPCDDPVFLPDVCCPSCLDVWSPSPTSTVISMTSTRVPVPSLPPPLLPVTTRIVVVLDIPFDDYLLEESNLLARLKDLVNEDGMEVSDVKASAYGKSQTYLVMELLLEKNMFMSDEEVAVMVASRSQGEAMVDRVGTVTDIPASVGKSGGPGDSREDSSGGSSQPVGMIVSVVTVTVSLVALLSLTVGIVAAIVIVRARRQSQSDTSKDSTSAKSDA